VISRPRAVIRLDVIGLASRSVLAELDRHPNARVLLGRALADGRPSHAYLFHGPGGAGKRAAARAVAAALLADGSPNPEGARARVMSGAHPDLTWVSPSGAHEILVSDIDEPVVAAASRTPFESTRRVFVVERADELGDEAANRMLKTLEEPGAYVHLILLTDRLAEVLPTIRSRCQLVRFEAPSAEEVAGELAATGVDAESAAACARLGLGDAAVARELAVEGGRALRAAAERFARAALAGEIDAERPWGPLLEAVRARGELARAELDELAAAELELLPRRERKRGETEWAERIRRVRRRVETGALDLGLELVSLWLADLAALAWGAADLVRNVDRREQLTADAGRAPARLREAIELVEDTRLRFQLNVSEELACEALAYRLERVLAR
jgi:DNA polymerase III subunit delta'